MCRKTFFWGPCWNIPTMWRILFGGLRAEIVLTRNQGFLEFVQGHFWGPWSNIDFSEKRSPLAVTYSYQQFSDIRLLLAPTGALILMMVRDISVAAAPAFSDFHSVHWCNWCYKSHSRLLQQYQCNWWHKSQMLNVEQKQKQCNCIQLRPKPSLWRGLSFIQINLFESVTKFQTMSQRITTLC